MSVPEKNRKRAPLAIATHPILITIQNSEAAAGLTGRQLRLLLSQHPEVPRVRIGERGGRLVGVLADDLQALLRRMATTGEAMPEPVGAEPEGVRNDHGRQPETADAVLAALGRRRVG